jgi:hypothetical protein
VLAATVCTLGDILALLALLTPVAARGVQRSAPTLDGAWG